MNGMQFIVRYWRGAAPAQGGQWKDYSSHPPTRRGLKNAVLSAGDREMILATTRPIKPVGCGIFLISDEEEVAFDIAQAEELLRLLGDGELTPDVLAGVLHARRKGENVFPSDIPLPPAKPSAIGEPAPRRNDDHHSIDEAI